MPRPSASDSSESSKSISSSEQHKTRSSTSRSTRSSRSRSSPVSSTSRSANPTTGALAAPRRADVLLPVRTYPSPRCRIRTLPRTTATAATAKTETTETPSVMSTTQTVTSTATAAGTESGFRAASSDGYYRYAGTLHFPARRSALIVTATGSNSTAASTSADNATSSGSGSHGSMHDRHGYSYSQTYPQIVDTTYTDEVPPSQTRASTSSHQTHSQTGWSMTTIAEIPASSTTADADANANANPSLSLSAEADSRSPISQYGPPSASDIPAASAGFLPNRITQPEHDHVSYYAGPYGSSGSSSASASGMSADRVDPEPAIPASLASYALTPSAAEASWRGSANAYPPTSPPPPPNQAASSSAWTPPPPFHALDANRTRRTRWEESSSSSGAATASYPVAQPSTTLPGASPTYTNSPVSSTDVQSTSWVPSTQPTTVDPRESTPTRSSRLYAIKVPQRPSLTRSALFPSSSSSSRQVLSFAASGASSTSVVAPTSASGSTAAPSRVPGPASPPSHPQYDTQSPVSPLRLSGTAGEHYARYVERAHQQVSPTAVLSPSSTLGGQQEAQASPPYGSGSYSPDSVRLIQSSSSPGYERTRHRDSAAPFQVPIEYGDGPVGRTPVGSGVKTRPSPSSSSGATTSDPSGSRGVSNTFVGTNIRGYSGPFGGISESDQSPASFAAKSNLSGTSQFIVPGASRAAHPYGFSYASSSSVPASLFVQASASGSRSSAGSSGSGGQSTRKRNHPCWMCHKSFDRPSTLRKHLLVHTGEKAFVCNICGRRFGVASNLNRHTRRCINKPVNSGAFHSVSTSAAGRSSTVARSSNSPSVSTSSRMAREQTNPEVRRAERVRDGREVPEEDQQQQQSAQRSTSESTAPPTRGRRRSRSPVQAPLGAQDINATVAPDASQQTSYQLRPAFDVGAGQASGSGQVAVATASASIGTGEETERRPKRRRRAPSPSRWVPASLRNFSLSPMRTRTSTPLPPVSPGYDAATGMYEERDSYATITNENVDPSGDNNVDVARTRAERMRNFEYAPYHPCGWTGRLPGPAVVGNDVTNYTKTAGGGGYGSGGRYHGGGTGGGIHFMFEFSLAAAG
ncbi:hypothetical protein ACEPAG_1317 [Sanghuangporus baumii]